MKINEEGFLPCPRCGSDDVEWTNTRDLNVLTSCVECNDCELITFNVESMAFDKLPNLDYETTVIKYNAWVKTNPKQYLQEIWE